MCDKIVVEQRQNRVSLYLFRATIISNTINLDYTFSANIEESTNNSHPKTEELDEINGTDNDLSHCNIVNLAASFDGGWQKRGYNSLSGKFYLIKIAQLIRSSHLNSSRWFDNPNESN